jgi:hypothetical protein
MILSRKFRVLYLSIAVTLVTGQLLQAAPIVAGPTTYPTIAIQDIVLFANTPINPGPELVIPGLSGVDVFGINREEQVGSTIEFNSLIGGRYLGSLPGIGDYAFGIVGGLTEADYSGQLTNVVQNPADPGFAAGDPSSFVSGEYYVSGDQFGFEFLTGPLTGVILFTDPTQDFSFVSTFDGLPPSPGTMLVNGGDDVLDVLLGDVIVGTSSNRRIVVQVTETVSVDIKPGSDPNPINLTSKGVLPVAILSTEEFDATLVDVDTLLFGDPLLIADGKAPVSPLRSNYEDVDDDGLDDLTLKFSMQDLLDNEVIGAATVEGYLAGQLVDGIGIAGRDMVIIVPAIKNIPEPSSVILILMGVLALTSCRRS